MTICNTHANSAYSRTATSWTSARVKSYREPSTANVASTQLAQSHTTRKNWRSSGRSPSTYGGLPSLALPPQRCFQPPASGGCGHANETDAIPPPGDDHVRQLRMIIPVEDDHQGTGLRRDDRRDSRGRLV